MTALQPAHRRDATVPRTGFPAPPPFEIEIRPSRERVVVAPHGELDCATVPRVQDALEELVAAGWDLIVLDLRGVSFMDSTALHLMSRETSRTDATIQLIDAAPSVSRL